MEIALFRLVISGAKMAEVKAELITPVKKPAISDSVSRLVFTSERLIQADKNEQTFAPAASVAQIYHLTHR